jgi:hypothetical protein
MPKSESEPGEPGEPEPTEAEVKLQAQRQVFVQSGCGLGI